MRLKSGVSLKGVRPETVAAMSVADSVYLRWTGVPVTITSVTDGVHSPGSLHYVGLAFDARTHYEDGTSWPDGTLETVVSELRSALGGMEFDVVKEDDHIHIEFQPKH